MNLLIISHTPHYRRGDRLVGWGPTIREIDALSELFDEITHMAPLHSGPVPEASLEYQSRKIKFIGIPPSGGKGLGAKLGILFHMPRYIGTMLRELSKADAVHVRCPCQIGLIAIVLLSWIQNPKLRWVKYAGNWRPRGKEPLSYAFQRFWLRKNFHRGWVTVSGQWAGDPPHVRSFFNPSFSEKEVGAARHLFQNKVLHEPVRFIFVARLEKHKGVFRALKIFERISRTGIACRLDLVGDGPQRKNFELVVKEVGLDSQVRFHGWLPPASLGPLYASSHFILHPSTTSEGWPKVLSEAMAHGAVVLASDVSSIPHILAQTGAGLALPAEDRDAFVHVVQSYLKAPESWKLASQAGIRASFRFTYESYLASVGELFGFSGKVHAACA